MSDSYNIKYISAIISVFKSWLNCCNVFYYPCGYISAWKFPPISFRRSSTTELNNFNKKKKNLFDVLVIVETDSAAAIRVLRYVSTLDRLIFRFYLSWVENCRNSLAVEGKYMHVSICLYYCFIVHMVHQTTTTI